MTYRLELSPDSALDLKRLDRVVGQRVLNRLKWLCSNFDSIAPEALSGEWQGLFKLRVGSYRVAYTANRADKIIAIHHIGHRKDIYKPK